LLGCLLVAEQEIGKVFNLGAVPLAILVESIVFGSLLAVFLVPPLVATIGIHRASLSAALVSALCLAVSVAAAPLMSAGALATAVLFFVATLLGFFVAVLSPVTQTLLNHATATDARSRRSLQSVWSAGQPTGFIVAAVAGGVLIERYGWWTALMVPLALALVSSLALLDRNIVHPSTRDEIVVRPGLNEIAWIILALVAFEIWTTWGSLRSWIEPGVLVTLMITVVVSIVAVGQLRRSSRPAVSLAPFSIAAFAGATFILFIYQFSTTAEFEVLLLNELGHLSPAEIGTRTAVGNAGQVAGTAIAALLLLRHQLGLALAAGFTLTVIGLAGYVLYPWSDNLVFAASTRTIAGFGSGLLTPVLFVIALNKMPSSYQVAAGTWLVLAMIGGTEVGLALFDMVLEVATGMIGPTVGSYLAVEIAQFVLGLATAIAAAWLIARGTLALTVNEAPVSSGNTAQAAQ
jgi:MFS family permease